MALEEGGDNQQLDQRDTGGETEGDDKNHNKIRFQNKIKQKNN